MAYHILQHIKGCNQNDKEELQQKVLITGSLPSLSWVAECYD